MLQIMLLCPAEMEHTGEDPNLAVASAAAPAAVGQRQRAMLREPDAGSYYLVHADDV